MNLRRRSLLIGLAAPLSGCIGTGQPAFLQSDVAWAQQVKISRDEYRRTTTIQGGDLDNMHATVFLRSTRLDSSPGLDGIVIYVFAKLTEWKFLDSGYATDGHEFKTVVVDRDVRYCSRYGCSLAEHVVLYTDRSYLRTKIDVGLDIRLDGKRGKHYIYLPPEYIVAFLASLPPQVANRS